MAKSNEVSFKQGDVLFAAGQGCDSFFIITEGQVEILKTTQSGDKIPIAVLNSGEFLGEMSILRNSTHTSTAIALTKVKAVKVSKKIFETELAKSPSIIKAIVNQLADRLTRVNETLRANNVVDDKVESAIKAFESKDMKKVA